MAVFRFVSEKNDSIVQSSTNYTAVDCMHPFIQPLNLFNFKALARDQSSTIHLMNESLSFRYSFYLNEAFILSKVHCSKTVRHCFTKHTNCYRKCNYIKHKSDDRRYRVDGFFSQNWENIFFKVTKMSFSPAVPEWPFDCWSLFCCTFL